jgi:GDP-D-mannose dehydratase
VKTALIAGVTGQDGAYLAHHLLGLGYRVVGSSRDAQMADTSRQFGVLRANGRRARHRRHPTAAPQPLCGGQGMFACTGILANHESPLSPGRASTIELGKLDIWRDWGWAPDYVQAMALMLQADTPSDYLPRRPLRRRIWIWRNIWCRWRH